MQIYEKLWVFIIKVSFSPVARVRDRGDSLVQVKVCFCGHSGATIEAAIWPYKNNFSQTN